MTSHTADLSVLKASNQIFTYVVVSDIHLGHDRTPTQHIISSFIRTVLTDANKDIHVLFINGDLFDQQLKLNSEAAQIIIQFFHKLLDYCYVNGIKLRVLEGTPSHDWYQSNLLVRLNDVRSQRADLVYHRGLAIENFPEYHKNILYIPDRWISSQSDLERQVNAAMGKMGLKQVDFAMLHGQCVYQTLGHKTKEFTYDEAYLHRLVKELIHIGHFHKYSHYDRIIANGSLERLAHGEEDPKGYVRVSGGQWAFIQNPYSYTYKTIKITAKTTLEKLDKIILKLPKGSYVRLYMDALHDFNHAFKDLQVRYLDYELTRKLKGDSSEGETDTYISDAEDLLQAAPEFTEINIYEMLMKSVLAKHQLSPSETEKFYKFSEIFINAETEASV